jgi:hypothetical protein
VKAQSPTKRIEAGHQLCTFKRLPYCEMLKGILFIGLFKKKKKRLSWGLG